jgi:hypothetical protein
MSLTPDCCLTYPFFISSILDESDRDFSVEVVSNDNRSRLFVMSLPTKLCSFVQIRYAYLSRCIARSLYDALNMFAKGACMHDRQVEKARFTHVLPEQIWSTRGKCGDFDRWPSGEIQHKV